MQAEECKGRILVVDDEKSVGELLQQWLTGEGYHARHARGFDEVRCYMEQEPFDLLTLDIMMPEVDGMEVLKWLKRQYSDVGAVMATALDGQDTIIEAMRLGATDFIIKPFNLDLVSEQIERAMERQRLIAENRMHQQELEQKVEARTRDLREANTRLQQNLEEIGKLSRAVEQSPASVVITDPEGTIEYVNPKFSRLTGYSLEEAVGQNPRILKSGEQPVGFYRELWKTIKGGGEWQGEFHNKKKNGELYWESASISPLCDAEGEITHFIAVKEDITARKVAEEALKNAHTRLERQVRELEGRDRLVQLQVSPPAEDREAYAAIVRTVAQVMGAAQVRIYCPDEDGNILEEKAGAVPPVSGCMADEERLSELAKISVHAGNSPVARVFREGCPDVDGSEVIVPMLYNTEVLGVLGMDGEWSRPEDRDAACSTLLHLGKEAALVLRLMQMAKAIESGTVEMSELLQMEE